MWYGNLGSSIKKNTYTMRRNKFNFLEIMSLHSNKKPLLISLLWKNSIFINFSKNSEGSCSYNFKIFIKKKLSSRGKSIQPLVFYLANLEYIFPSVLSLRDEENTLDNVKFLIIGNRIYFLRLKIEGNWVLFKNAGLLLNIDLSEESQINARSYIPLGFYKEVCQESGDILNYLLNEKDSNKIKFILKNNNETLLKKEGFFFSEITSNESNKTKITISMRNNLLFLSEGVKELDEKLCIFWKGWYFNYSIPSISKEIFNRFFNDFNIKFEMSFELDKIIRNSYYGGRCEIYGNPGKEDLIYHFDFNNMYGQVMLEDFPTGELKYLSNPENFDKPGFYFINAKSLKMFIPILPIKEEYDFFGNITWEKNVDLENRGLFFPNGEISGLYYSEEIKLFVQEGGLIKNISYAWIYGDNEKPIFKGFSKKLIDLRKEDNSSLWKQIIVSLYGRMGMVPKNSTAVLGDKHSYTKLIMGKDVIREVWFNDYCIAEVRENPKENVFSRVDYAAIITSKARVKLWKKLKELNDLGVKLLYCDTDSIFFSFGKETKLSLNSVDWSGGRLSKIEDAVFSLQRTYSIKIDKDEWETKISGLPRNSIDFEKFKKRFFEKEYYGLYVRKTVKNIYSSERWVTSSSIGLKTYNKRYFNIDKKKTIPPFRVEEGGPTPKMIKDPYF
uniref:DNA-directed DNA polymerase n=1 Tax=Oxytricha trifallax TaxID=1172189 RepID=G9HRA3_9SPIT|nr:polymerase [Oxytricha trifallax]